MKETGCRIGFLLVDGNKNTLLLDYDTVKDILRYHGYNLGELVKQHKTLSELDKDIRKYLKCDYRNGG